MPQIDFPEFPGVEDTELLERYFLELHNRLFGHGSGTTGDLDDDNISSDFAVSKSSAITITGTWTFSTHPLGLDHTQLSNIGTSTHAQIDTHLAGHSDTILWSEIDKTISDIADITTKSHTSLADIGTNTHAQIDTHIADSSDPHGSTLTQTTLNVTGNLDVDGDIDYVGGKMGVGVAPVTGCRITLPIENDAVTATFGFGDGGDGLYSSADGQIDVAISGSRLLIINSNGLQGNSTNAFWILNENATATNPTLVPCKADPNSGLGWGGADQLTIISGGVEFIRLEEAATDYIDFKIGAVALDTGAATLGNLPKGATTSQNESRRVKINGNVRYIPLWA